MGLKSAMAYEMPPPPGIDPEVAAKEAASKAKLEAEKKKATSVRMKGRGGTIMTSGTGVTDEAQTGKSILQTY